MSIAFGISKVRGVIASRIDALVVQRMIQLSTLFIDVLGLIIQSSVHTA